MESQAARLAALPPPVLPGAVVPPSREGWRQRPPDAAMDALHGWLSSAAMTRLLNLRIGEHRQYSDAASQPSNVRSVTPLPRMHRWLSMSPWSNYYASASASFRCCAWTEWLSRLCSPWTRAVPLAVCMLVTQSPRDRLTWLALDGDNGTRALLARNLPGVTELHESVLTFQCESVPLALQWTATTARGRCWRGSRRLWAACSPLCCATGRTCRRTAQAAPLRARSSPCGARRRTSSSPTGPASPSKDSSLGVECGTLKLSPVAHKAIRGARRRTSSLPTAPASPNEFCLCSVPLTPCLQRTQCVCRQCHLRDAILWCFWCCPKPASCCQRH